MDKAVLKLERFIRRAIIGYIIIKTAALRAVAGKTTTKNSSVNNASAPNTNIAVDKKIVPEISVPMQVSKTPTASLLTDFCNKRTSAKKINAVTNLSIIFGTKPPGNVENRPEIIPVVTPNKKTFFACGNKRMDINIITKRKSGFIPPIIPGVIM